MFAIFIEMTACTNLRRNCFYTLLEEHNKAISSLCLCTRISVRPFGGLNSLTMKLGHKTCWVQRQLRLGYIRNLSLCCVNLVMRCIYLKVAKYYWSVFHFHSGQFNEN